MNTNNNALPPFGTIWNFANPAGTRERFLELVPLAKELGDESYLLQLQTQLARTYSLQGNFAEAHSILDSVEELLSPEHQLPRLRYLLERGRCYNSNGEKERALTFFMDAVRLGEEIADWRLAIDAVHMVAIAQPNVYDKITWNLRGLKLVEEHPEQDGWFWALYNNLGEDYMTAQQYDEAHATFEKLLALQVQRNGATDMYTVKDCARALRLGAKPEDSVRLMQAELDILLSKSSDDGWIREELAEALTALGLTAEARPHFVAAYRLLKDDSYCLQYEQAKLARLQEMATEDK